MLMFVGLLMLLLNHRSDAQLSAGSQCTSPDGQGGSCTTIRECPFLWELLTQRRPIAGMSATTYLQRSQCGFQGRIPIVCCPGTAPKTTKAPPTNRPNPPKPNRPGTNVPVSNPQITSTVVKPQQSQPIQNPLNHRNLALLSDECGTDVSDKIVGGTTARIGEHPWLVGLEYQTRKGLMVACGGVLISQRYVLTAAHCIGRVPNAQLIGVRLGEHNLNTDPDCEQTLTGSECADPVVRIPIEKVTPHPEYKSSDPNKHNDIGIIRLRSAAKYTAYVRSLCLPTNDLLLRSTFAGTQQTVAGWGRTETSSNSDIKLQVTIPVLENQRCTELYNGRVKLSTTQMCAGGQAGKDSCSGDSGGPLMTPQKDRWFVTGIVSVGPQKCGTQNQPGVYTRVAPFVTWILDNMRNDSACFTPPTGEEGECINIRTCPSILALLRESPRKPDTVQKVQAAQCGMDGTVPKVCCPITTTEIRGTRDTSDQLNVTDKSADVTAQTEMSTETEATEQPEEDTEEFNE